MANVLSLAVKITGDASGLQKSLTPAERAFATLGQQADRATAAFAPFADASEAAARAQQQAATDFAFLANALKTGQISAQEYTAAFAQFRQRPKQLPTHSRPVPRRRRNLRPIRRSSQASWHR